MLNSKQSLTLSKVLTHSSAELELDSGLKDCAEEILLCNKDSQAHAAASCDTVAQFGQHNPKFPKKSLKS
jgi:hypothetical protein